MHDTGTVAGLRRTTWRLAVSALLLSGAAFACALSDALTGPKTAAIVLRFSGDTELVVGAATAFAVTAEVAGAPLPAARFRYTIEDTAIAYRTSIDSIVARRRGSTRLIATLTSPMLSQAPTLTVPLDVVVGGVAVVPALDTLTSIDDTLLLAAPAFDAQGGVIAGATPAWSSSDTTIAVFVGPGRLVARRNGYVVVRARVDNDTGVGTVVVAQRVAQIQATPSILELSALTVESTVVARGLDARGHPLSGVLITWGSEASTIASVTAAGRVRAVDNGTTRIFAQSGPLRDTVTTIVEQRAKQVGILPEPVPAIVALGDQVSLTASATDSLGFVVTVPNKTTGWATLDPTIVTVDRNGLVTGVGVGSKGRIVAVMDAARDTVSVDVGDRPASIVIQPTSATLASVKDTLLLAATVRNSRGNLIQSPVITWHASDTTITRVDTMPRPLAVAVGAGTVRIIAVAGSIADTCLLTVTNAPAVFDISLVADTLTSIWDSLRVPIVIRNARDDTLPSSAVQWSSAAPLVGSVDASGLVVARDTGATVVRAKYGIAPGDTLRDSIVIRVFNQPAFIALSEDGDTLTAVGQSIGYTGAVRNARGNPIPGYTIAWSSTNPSAVSVSTGGVVTATGFGSAFVIGQAGGMADTVVNVVVNPTRLIVDNAVAIAPRFGTRKRPYARIQDAVTAAELDDTVFVRRGSAPYAETVALTRRVTLLGDDSAFAASLPRDPLLLPLISHDTGAAAITAYTVATVVIKNLALRHTVAGVGIDARQADLRVTRFYINPPGTVAGRVGRGIALDSSSSATASITSSEFRSLRGYGIRVRYGASVVIDTVLIDTIDSVPGEPGAGIRVYRGSGHAIRHTTIRGTQGPGILVDSSANVTIASNDLAGRQRLLRIRWSNAATIQSNLFDTRPLGVNGEVYLGGSQFEWAGLEIQASLQAVVTGNSFRDLARADQEPMNGMRFVDMRTALPPFYGAQLFGNRVIGSRAGIRSERSYLYVQGSSFDSTLTAVLGVDTDVLVLQDDTLRHAVRDRCLTASSAVYTSLSNTVLDDCTTGAAHAVMVTGGQLYVQTSEFSMNRAAVRFNGSTFSAQANTISGAGFTPAPSDTSTAIAAAEVIAPTVTVVENTITGHRLNAGLRVEAGNGSARIDSNFVSENIRGVRLGKIKTLTMRDNDVFDNDIAGVVNEDAAIASVPGTWWGDARGPRGAADLTATGDSVAGFVNTNSRSTVPHGAESTATTLWSVRGNGQSGPRGVALQKAFTVRVKDASGRAVAGIAVTFQVTAGDGSFAGATTVTVTTNASGLAELTLTLGATPGINTVTVTAPGVNALTFTATGT